MNGDVYKARSCNVDTKYLVFMAAEGQTGCMVLNTSNVEVSYGIDECYDKHPYICVYY